MEFPTRCHSMTWHNSTINNPLMRTGILLIDNILHSTCSMGATAPKCQPELHTTSLTNGHLRVIQARKRNSQMSDFVIHYATKLWSISAFFCPLSIIQSFSGYHMLCTIDAGVTYQFWQSMLMSLTRALLGETRPAEFKSILVFVLYKRNQ